MKLVVLLVASLCLFCSVFATNSPIFYKNNPKKFGKSPPSPGNLQSNAKYYFSSANGDDSRTSAQAQSPATPWKTLAKLNTFFPNLKPGDAVLFNSGETFPGQIIISNSGAQNLPILISSYGTGDKPVISGMKVLTQWTSAGNNIYESALNAGKYLSMVTVNAAAVSMGRWPNLTDPNKGYLTIDNNSKTVSGNGNYTGGTITDANLPGSINWTGAQAVIRKRHWVLDRCPITNQSGSTITYLTPSVQDVINGFGYFIQNSAATLDKQGEWYYNPIAKTFRMYSTVNPSSLSVKAAVVDTLVYLNNHSFITFDNVSFQNADTLALKIENNSSHISIQNCDFNFSGMRAIVATSSTYIAVENCTFNNTYGETLLFTNCSNSSLRNNSIKNNCMKAGMSEDFNGTAAIYLVHESNTLLEYNSLDSLGSSGIAFLGENVIVKNNLINHFNMIIDDGAGIYTWSGGVPGNILYGRKIVGNIVVNGIGAPEGTETVVANASNGIYTDDLSQNVEITGNTCANVSRAGLFLHNAQNIQIKNNTLFNNQGAQILMAHDGNGYVDVTVNGQTVTQEYSIKNIEMADNILYGRTAAQGVLSQENNISSNMLFGSYDSNYYARPMNRSGLLNTSFTNGNGGNTFAHYELDGWRNKYGWDRNSKNAVASISPYKIISSTGINRFSNPTFSNNAAGVESENTITWENKIDGGSVQINSSSKTANLAQANMSIGKIVAGTSYLVKFTVQGSTNTENIGAYIRKWGGNYAILSETKSFRLATERTECEFIFNAATTEQEAKLVIFAAESVTPFWFDNISATQVTVNVTNPDDSLRFEYNASNVVKRISLDGSYTDAMNNKYIDQVNIEPYSSIVLTKTASGQSVKQSQNQNPVANAGADINISLPTNWSPLNGAASADADGTIVSYKWTVVSADGWYNIEYPAQATTGVYNMNPGTYVFRLQVTDNNGAVATDDVTVTVNKAVNNLPVANAGTDLKITIPTNWASLNGASSSDADGTIVSYKWTVVSADGWYNLEFPDRVSTGVYNLDLGTYVFRLQVTDNNGAVATDDVTVTVNKAVNNLPVANAGTDLKITIPTNWASLNGASSSDADGTIVSYKWTVVSADGWYNLEYPDRVSTGVYNLDPGTYVFRLQVTDNNGGVATDDVTVTVIKPVNNLPVANAGTDLKITIPTNWASLNGASSSDADGTIVSYKWTVVSADGWYNLEFPDRISTGVYNLDPGTYVFRLQVTDNNGAVATDDVTVTVIKPVNKVPVANAGTDMDVYMPTNWAPLNGTSSSDADGTIVSYKWTVVSADSWYNIEYPNQSTTGVYNMNPGTYVFRLQVTDNNGAVSTDDVTVTVGAYRTTSAQNLTGLSIVASSNPSTVSFQLSVRSQNSTQPITLIITDNMGNVQNTYTNVGTNNTVSVGSNYRIGNYYAIAKQGSTTVTIQLIKF